MRVLFVASIYRHLEFFHIPFMLLLKSKGYEVYAAAASDTFSRKELLKHGIPCYDIPFARSPLNAQNLKALRELKTLIKEEDFDLIHVHTPVASLLTRFAYKKYGNGKIIYTAHGFHFYKGAPLLNWLLYYPAEKSVVKWTDALITINNEDYNRALNMGYKKENVYLVHGVGVEQNSLDEEVFDKKLYKQNLGLKENDLIISYIAEINENKNHRYLIGNWNKIKLKVPNSVLLIIGDGVLKEELEKKILAEEIEGIIFLGQRNDVNKLLQITDILSLLSYREGLPKSIMEAMINKVPCIVSNTRGLRDLIIHNENGYVVNQNKNEELVNAFIKLLKDENTRRTMGEKSKEFIQPYLLKNVLEEYEEIYDEVLRNN
ncbi:glycosyltransferase family 4 protein [Planococcus sp. NCCP-2050]|uniref:glycosyltransferase family 4 protein n=1 Tax=Planococcus sp. NCCP-2050 TaxID=2944679 RepID=UPI0020419B3B|nr:glycosyltransferase family 4 protein [Planococcus sp. NCCP-2050]GKW45322.1 glycosyl transferase family 1 [Planococcus sp. NCCP-2050]